MSVRIVTDSSCDLPDDLLTELGIEVVPLSIRFGTTELIDRTELSTDEFWARSANSDTLPETAAPAPGAFEATFRRLLDGGASDVVCINLSSALSATMQSAQLAASAVDPARVHVVDSRSATVGVGLMCVAAARAARDGASAAAIVAMANDLAGRTRIWGALDTLENLRKGGRIGGAKAMLASVLSIKPIIQVVDGSVAEGGKQRTRAKALAFLIDQVRAAGPLERLAVMHAKCADVDSFVGQLRQVYDGEIIVGEIGAVIGAHTGAGTIGVVMHVA